MVSRPSNCHRVTLRTLWNMQDGVHISHNDKPGTQLSLRYCGLEYTSWYHQLQRHHTDHRYNLVCAPSYVSGQCRNNLIFGWIF